VIVVVPERIVVVEYMVEVIHDVDSCADTRVIKALTADRIDFIAVIELISTGEGPREVELKQ
jgi:hypothetical protein